MEIVYKKTEGLTPYENNPRRNEDAVSAVASSIRDFGFRVPIIVDGNGVVIAGHTRLKAAKKLGLEEVPCVVADDLTEEQANALRLVDNKTSELAGWDWTALEEEISKLANIDLTAYGFNESVLGDLNIDDFFSEAEPKKPKHKTIVCPHCGEEFEV